MPACRKCGKELKADAVFCTACGSPVTSYGRKPAVAAPQAAPQPEPKPPRSKTATVAYFFVGLAISCVALYGVSVLYAGYSIRKATASGFHNYNSGRYLECAENYRYLTRKAPKNEENWAMNGDCLSLAGNNAEAAKILKNALKWHPDSARLLTSLGVALFNRGKYAEAAKNFRKAIKKDPSNALPHYHLGLAYEMLNKPGPAIENLEKALPLTKDKIKVLEPLGRLYSATGKHELAVKALEEALKIDPNKFSLRLAACGALCAMNEFRKALLHCDAALAIDPGSEEAKKLRKRASDSLVEDSEAGYIVRRRVLDRQYINMYGRMNAFITKLNEKMRDMLGQKNAELEKLETESVALEKAYQAITPPERYFTVHAICLGNVVILQQVIKQLEAFVETATPDDRSRFEELAVSINALSDQNKKLREIWENEDKALEEAKKAEAEKKKAKDSSK